jgi:hypothetical protein
VSITLTYGVTPLALPDDLLWVDEDAWRAVEQRTQYTITGALLVEAYAKQSGRTITLQGGPDYAWMPRATLDTLRAWAALPAQAFVLNLHGTDYDVILDHAAGAITAAPVIDYATPAADDPYAVTLRFLEI